jgi:hypothetical protein
VADKSIASSDVFESISLNSANAVFHEGRIPAGSISDAPSVSTQSEVRKGEDLVIEITVPENAQQLYISASSIKAAYLTLEFGDENDDVDGYFTLETNPTFAKKPKSTLLLKSASGSNMQTYTVKIETNQNTYMNSFDINIAYQSPDGVSRTVKVPISINALLPIHNQLRVGFRPPETDGFSLCIERPDGSQVCYSNGTLSTGGCRECEVSYDDMMDVYWIDLPPDFGSYTVTAEMSIACTQNQVITLVLIINNAGKLEYYDGDFDVIGTIDDPTCIGRFTMGFSFCGASACSQVDIRAYRPYNSRYLVKDDVPYISESKEVIPGVGIRVKKAGNPENLLMISCADLSIDAPSNMVYQIERTSNSVNIWADKELAMPVLYSKDIAEIDISSGEYLDFWLEATSPIISEEIILTAKDTNTSRILSADTIRIFTFKSLIACIRGESFGSDNAILDNSQGVFCLSDSLYKLGYDARRYSDDDVDESGHGIAFIDIIDAIQYWNINEICIIGYSHGGGATYNLSKLIDDELRSKRQIEIPLRLTAYIDAIEYEKIGPCDELTLKTYAGPNLNCRDLDWFCEKRRPVNTDFHINYYQTFDKFSDDQQNIYIQAYSMLSSIISGNIIDLINTLMLTENGFTGLRGCKSMPTADLEKDYVQEGYLHTEIHRASAVWLPILEQVTVRVNR